jgi:hypothetical protein
VTKELNYQKGYVKPKNFLDYLCRLPTVPQISIVMGEMRQSRILLNLHILYFLILDW